MNKFEKYALKETPFDIFSYEHNMANREKEWEKITTSLISAFEGKGPRYFVLLGDYGMGKTYMLEQIYSWLSKGEKEHGVFAIYTKRDILYERRLTLMESEPRWSKFGLDFIMRIFDNIERGRLVDVLQKANLKGFESKFIKVFEALRGDKEVGLRYITGQKLGAKDYQQLGVDSPITDSPTGLALFFDFLRVINRAGYRNFLLLVDEFEYIAAQGEKRIIQILNTFREIFDDFGDYSKRHAGAIVKPLFLFATSPGGWDRLTELEAALTKKIGGAGIAPFMRRVSRHDMLTLGPFTKENTLELVQIRLSEARIGKVDDPLFPFTKKSIEHVHEVSFYKPGNVIQYCGILLEDALDENLKRIDATDAKRILQKYGIYPTESESAKKSS